MNRLRGTVNDRQMLRWMLKGVKAMAKIVNLLVLPTVSVMCVLDGQADWAILALA